MSISHAPRGSSQGKSSSGQPGKPRRECYSLALPAPATELHRLCRYADVSAVRSAMQEAVAEDDINEVAGPFGCTPLHEAAISGNADIIQFLVEEVEGVDLDIRTTVPPLLTPLHLAAEQGHGDAVIALLDSGATVGAVDQNFKTPKDLALELEKSEVVHIITKYELHNAVKKEDLNAIQKLLKMISSQSILHSRDSWHREKLNRCLFHAAKIGNRRVVAALVRAGARNFQECMESNIQVNHINAFLKLCQAAYEGDKDSIDVLLSTNEDAVADHPLYNDLMGYRFILAPLISNGKISLSIPIQVALCSCDVSTAGHILLCSSKQPSSGMLDWHDLDLTHLDMDWLDVPDANMKMHFIGLSSNALTKFPLEILQFKNLQKLQIHNNKLSHLPSELLTMPKLKHLDASFNRLASLPDILTEHGISESLIELNLAHNRITSLPSYIQFSSLQSIDLSFNNLQVVPVCLLQTRQLCSLNLSNNIGLERIPYEFGKLRNLTQLSIDNLPYLSNFPTQDKINPLAFLRQRARGMQQFEHYDVMLVGAERYQDTLEVVHKSARIASKRKGFSLLKFTNVQHFLHFHRLLALPSSIYVVIWDCENNQNPDDLILVLTHLSIYVPNSKVIVAACWQSPVIQRMTILAGERIRSSHWNDLTAKVKIENICINKDALCPRHCSVDGLFDLVDREAAATSSSFCVPNSYFALITLIRRHVTDCQTEGKVPLINERELWELVSASPHHDLVSRKELSSTISFLSSVAILVHLPSGCSDVLDCFAIDRQWLLGIASSLLDSPKGTMSSDSGLFLPTCLIDLFDCPLLQSPLPYPLHYFASQQGLAISVTSTKCLIPAMLRSRNTGFLSSCDFTTQFNVRRVFTFRLTPASFWGKIIAHILVNVGQFLSDSTRSDSFDFSPTMASESIPGEERANWTYWRKGIIVWVGGDLVFSADAISPVTEPTYREGLEVRVSNTPLGMNAMNIVTATICSFLSNWHWQVWETVEVLVPCPACFKENAAQPTLFLFEDCCQAFSNGDTLKCANHEPSFEPVDLIPDVLQPKAFDETICLNFIFANPAALSVNFLEKSSCLSQPPSETVFRGMFNSRIDIAMKTFPHPVSNANHRFSAQSSFLNFFHEFTILNHLRNSSNSPLLVSMIAASCHPLGLIFPYAQYGSLEEVIMEPCIAFPTPLRVRIVKQLAEALEALHISKVMHRHVCLTNILVYSLSLDDQVNIKLGGFSEACFGMQQGLSLGIVGEFPAPEMSKPRLEYDERVDVFAFAFTSYEILTRKKLHSWQGVPFQTALVNDSRPSLSPISNLLPYYSPLLERCWEKKPSKRPFFVEIVNHFKLPLHYVTRGGRCVNLQHELYTATTHFSRDAEGEISTDVYLCSGVLSNADNALLTHLSYPGLEVLECTTLPSHYAICMCCTNDQLWVSFQSRFVRVYSAKSLEFIKEIRLSHHTLAMVATPYAMYLGLESGEVHMFKTSRVLLQTSTHSANVCNGKPVKSLDLLYCGGIFCVGKNHCYQLNPISLKIEQQWLVVSETEVKCAVMAKAYDVELEHLWVGFRRSQEVVAFSGKDGKAIYGINCSEILKCEKSSVWVQTMCVVIDTVWVGLNSGHIISFSAFSPTPLLLSCIHVHNGCVRDMVPLNPPHVYSSSASYYMQNAFTQEGGTADRTSLSSTVPFLPSPRKTVPILSCGQGIHKALPMISSDGFVAREEASSSSGLFAVVLEGHDEYGTNEVQEFADQPPLPYMAGHRQMHSYTEQNFTTGIPTGPHPTRMISLEQGKPVQTPSTSPEESNQSRDRARDPAHDPDLKGWEVLSFSDAPIPVVGADGRSSTMPSGNIKLKSKFKKKPKKNKETKKANGAVANGTVANCIVANSLTGDHPSSCSSKQELEPLNNTSDEDEYIHMKGASVKRTRLHTISVVSSAECDRGHTPGTRPRFNTPSTAAPAKAEDNNSNSLDLTYEEVTPLSMQVHYRSPDHSHQAGSVKGSVTPANLPYHHRTSSSSSCDSDYTHMTRQRDVERAADLDIDKPRDRANHITLDCNSREAGPDDVPVTRVALPYHHRSSSSDSDYTLMRQDTDVKKIADLDLPPPPPKREIKKPRDKVNYTKLDYSKIKQTINTNNT